MLKMSFNREQRFRHKRSPQRLSTVGDVVACPQSSSSTSGMLPSSLTVKNVSDLKIKSSADPCKRRRRRSATSTHRLQSTTMFTTIIASGSSIAFIIVLIIAQIYIGTCYAEPRDSRESLSRETSTDSTNATDKSKISVTSSISSSSGSSTAAFSSSTRRYVPVTQVPPKVSKRANTADAKSKKTIIPKDTSASPQQQNRSREALSHEGSERESIVYLPDSSGYVPVNYRGSGGRHPPPQSSPGGTGAIVPSGAGIGGGTGPSAAGGIGGAATGGGGYHTGPPIEIDAWRPDPWDRDYQKRLRHNNTRVQHIEAECQDDYMKIRIGFNGSFTGLLYSAGYAYDPDCMYINGSGRDYYEFYIQLNRCGTLGKNALHDDNRKNPTNFMWNTITVQYNPLIEEEFDEHFKVTCEYGYDFWKTVTFPFLDVEVATGNPVVFTLSPPECYMEIRNGYGISGARVAGPVRVGDPLTLIIYMRSKYDGFDIVVNDCFAHNGANKRIQLIDEYGCPVDEKLISRFRGSWSDTGVYETQVYAYMKTFRFTGSPALYIECDVRMCHGRCPSQPCHWRNLKGVAKRDVSAQISNNTAEILDDKNLTTESSPLSDNVNLFQSLRVLQEGEDDEDDVGSIARYQSHAETCLKTTLLSAIAVVFSILICILTALLVIACAKLRYRKKDSGLYDAYINHKGHLS